MGSEIRPPGGHRAHRASIDDHEMVRVLGPTAVEIAQRVRPWLQEHQASVQLIVSDDTRVTVELVRRHKSVAGWFWHRHGAQLQVYLWGVLTALFAFLYALSDPWYIALPKAILILNIGFLAGEMFAWWRLRKG